jgi:2-hydroxychromene-2-carboxylate isomerase
MKKKIRVYTDYKSPYAYVANKPLFELERTHDVELEWLPYTLRIAEYLGSVDDRSDHYWRKVKYAYMDARRYANAQGLILKGPKRIYNGYLSSVGMLFAQKHGFFRAYHDTVFEMFWTHQLDLDVLDEMKAVVSRLGGSGDDYAAYTASAREEHDAIIVDAEKRGVFGVPAMLLDGELFWGGDRIDLLRERIEKGPQDAPRRP